MLIHPSVSSAQGDEPVVCIIAPPDGSSRIVSEASLRVRAELKAAGFEVVGDDNGTPAASDPGRWECPLGAATITLEVEGQVLTIWSQVSAEHKPLSQKVSLKNPETTSEVIAIRAVDGLRAAVLEALVVNQSQISRPLAEFASARPPKDDVVPESSSPAPSRTSAPTVEKRDAPRSSPKERTKLIGIVAFGPELAGGASAPGLSLGGSFDLWWKAFGLGLAADVALLGPTWEAQGARITSREYGLGVRAQVAPCPKPFWCQAGAGISIRTVGFDAVRSVADSELLERGAHTSPSVDLGMGLGYWLSGSVGVAATGWIHVYTNGARLVLGTEETMWGRPSYTLALGPFFRL